MSRATLGGATCGEVICTPGTPPATITSASPSVAQQMPSAPAAACISAMRRDLCVLACGRSATPTARACSAMAARLRSSASRSISSAGVSSSARPPFRPISAVFGPNSLMPAIIASAATEGNACRRLSRGITWPIVALEASETSVSETSEREIAFLTAGELVEAYRRETLSPVEVTEALLRRLDRLERSINAFVFVARESALAEARASEARWARGEPRGLLDGVPVTIKDLFLTQGWPTLRGSTLIRRDQDWSEDGPPVARLREHGAVLLGKTTMPEFGWKALGDSPLTGITRNPWSLAHTPGGSSAGAAAALAAGIGPLALGTDGGGSIRIPCAFCGLPGLKPSFGRVPHYPP